MSGLPVYEDPGLRQAGNGLIRPGGLALTKRALSLSGLERGAGVLDIGCGTGAATEYLVRCFGLRAIGIDPSKLLLSEGRRRSAILPLLRASGEHIPIAGGVLDAVLAECSLSVTKNAAGVLRECSRVLKPSGLLIVTDVYARNPEGVPGVLGLPLECCLTGAVSKEEWVSRLETAGFELVVWEDHTKALKEFAAQLIFSYGSLETFWCRSQKSAPKEEIKEAGRVVSKARPGYFMMIARNR